MNSVAVVERRAYKVGVGAPVRSNQSFSWDAVTVSELRLGDSDLPQRTATRTSVMLQVSAPAVVDLGLHGRYERRSIGPGKFCLTPAGALVPAARWRGQRRIIVAELSPLLISSVAESHSLRSFELVSRHAVSDPQIAHLMLTLRDELLSAAPSGKVYVELIARAMAIRLLRAHAISTPLRTHRGGLSQALLRRVIEYIDAHLDQDLGLRSLAEVAGLSEDHFARTFRESTGMPPYRYLLQRRLTRARELLETSDMPIAEIAQTLGFADQSHLTNLLRRDTGMTPGKLRAHFGRKPEGHRNPSKVTGILQEAKIPLRLLS